MPPSVCNEPKKGARRAMPADSELILIEKELFIKCVVAGPRNQMFDARYADERNF
jgi:hypothetical protein